MIKFKKDTHFYFLVFLSVFLVVAILGASYTPLFDEDEGFFAEAARKMIETNDYVKIQVNGEERYDKPALFFWLEVLSMKFFGVNEFAVRLPSFLSFLMLGVYLFRFVKKRLGLSKARIAIGILIGILQFQLLSKAAVTDNLLNLCLTAALFHYLTFKESQSKRQLFLFYVFLGLGFLTKGPVAWVIPVLVILPYHLIRKEWKELLKLLNPLGLLVCILIPLIWFYPAFKSSGEFMILDFFLKHNLGRFSETMESHGGQLWYYIPVLFLAFIPFVHLFNKALVKSLAEKDNLFFTLWFVLTFLLFSVSKTQLPHYISYGYIPLIILMAKNSTEYATLGFKIQVVIFFLIFTLIPASFLWFEMPVERAFLKGVLAGIPLVFDEKYFIMMCLLMVCLIYCLLQRSKQLYAFLAIFISGTALFMSAYGKLQQGFVKEAGLVLKESRGELEMTNHYNPSLSFYAQHSMSISKEFESGKYYFIAIDKYKEDQMELISEGSGFGLVRVL